MKKFNLVSGISSSSYGIVGFNIFKELCNRGYTVSLFPISQIQAPIESHDLIKQSLKNAEFYDSNSPSLRIWHQNLLAERVGRVHVGFPIFELDKFSQGELNHLQQLDKLVVCSDWAKNICTKSGVNGQVLNKEGKLESFGPSLHIAPLGVDRSIFHENVLPAKDFDGATVFGNFGKWEYRKGHDILVQAFNEAFNEDDNVYLIMHCYNWLIGDQSNKEWTELYTNSKMGLAGKILVSHGRAETQQEVASLMACCTCGVFPARAEGWNLEALELLSMGKQLIITNCTGHTEFCTDDNSLLIERSGEMEEAEDSVFFFGQGNWITFTDEMLQDLIEKMRMVHKNKKKVNFTGIETAKRLSWQNTVDKLLEIYE